jgi:Bacteriophage tail sheath protein
MSSDVMWKYVNVRRLFIFSEQSIDRGTQRVVFEPTSKLPGVPATHPSPDSSAFSGAIGSSWGTTQDQAFFVRCDLTTMTQDDIDNGRLIWVIGVAVIRPAEFMIFRISQKTMEAADGQRRLGCLRPRGIRHSRRHTSAISTCLRHLDRIRVCG